jgi:hypothetical protein
LLDVPGVGGNFSGSLAADGKAIAGNWSQGGMDFPIELKMQ